MAVFIVLFLHESYPYVILKKKTARLRQHTGNRQLRSALEDTSKTPRRLFAFSILRPLKMLISRPIVFLMSAYAATVFSYAYLCFTTFARVFRDQYAFGSGASGLTSIGLGIGFVVGLLFCGAVSDPWSAYLAKKNGGLAAGVPTAHVDCRRRLCTHRPFLVRLDSRVQDALDCAHHGNRLHWLRHCNCICEFCLLGRCF